MTHSRTSTRSRTAQQTSRPSSSRVGVFRSLAVGLVFVLGLGVSDVAADITIVGPLDHLATIDVTGLPEDWSGTVTLNPDPVIHLDPPLAGSDFMVTFFADEPVWFPGWTAVAVPALAGVLGIGDYLAVDRGAGDPPLPGWGGARMDATYAPAEGEIPEGTELTFIQMFKDSDGDIHIDPIPNDDTEPFYYTADQRADWGLTFNDNPAWQCPEVVGTTGATFETYLASFHPGIKTVYIHDGWSWGYEVEWEFAGVPEPASLALLAVGGVGPLLRRRAGV